MIREGVRAEREEERSEERGNRTEKSIEDKDLTWRGSGL